MDHTDRHRFHRTIAELNRKEREAIARRKHEWITKSSHLRVGEAWTEGCQTSWGAAWHNSPVRWTVGAGFLPAPALRFV